MAIIESISRLVTSKCIRCFGSEIMILIIALHLTIALVPLNMLTDALQIDENFNVETEYDQTPILQQ